MRPWKPFLGVGAACVACCAVPLVGGVATWTVGASALLACADEFAPLAAGLLSLAVLVGATAWWLRRVGQARAPA